MLTFASGSIGLLNAMIEKDPSSVIGFICSILGAILNFLFNIAYAVTESGSLGISVILLTIIVRIIMFPTGIKSQQSMAITQRLAPQVDKIKKKYGDSKDPELQRKMNVEIQALYSKSGANPIMGCLPLLITMPIFLALFALFKNSYLYVGQLNRLYTDIATNIINLPSYVDSVMNHGEVYNIIFSRIPKGMEFSFGNPADIARFVNKCSTQNWIELKALLPGFEATVQPLLDKKIAIESFFSINLIDNSGWSFPGIIIPILSAAASFLTSFISMRQTKTADSATMQTQKMMMIGFPIMMIFMTASASAGVGIYWIASSLFQAGQQFVLHKYYTEERLNKLFEKNAEKNKIKEAKRAEKKALVDNYNRR